MQIANPIYDVVFKYLMEDNKIAKLVISSIIDQEIDSLEFQSTEGTVELQDKSLTVYRLDFAAKIKSAEGFKKVIIEIQKAKLPTDITRFRKYISEQYGSPHNIYTENISHKEVKKAMPIISIYFLGQPLENITVPIIKVQRSYYDRTTGEEIKEREEFIESLTHDSFVIQISKLRRERQTELEILLSVFDQKNIDDDNHILNVKEEDFPEKHRPIIRRLQRAIAEPKVRKTMDMEDEILEELQNMERQIERRDIQIEEDKKAIEEKDKAIEEKDKAIEEKDKAIEDKDKTIEDKDKAIEEKDKAIEDKDKIIEDLNKKLNGNS